MDSYPNRKKSPLRYKIIRTIRDRIQAYAPERVILFGAYARGEADDLSDVDLVVIKETDRPFFERAMDVL